MICIYYTTKLKLIWSSACQIRIFRHLFEFDFIFSQVQIKMWLHLISLHLDIIELRKAHTQFQMTFSGRDYRIIIIPIRDPRNTRSRHPSVQINFRFSKLLYSWSEVSEIFERSSDVWPQRWNQNGWKGRGKSLS